MKVLKILYVSHSTHPSSYAHLATPTISTIAIKRSVESVLATPLLATEHFVSPEKPHPHCHPILATRSIDSAFATVHLVSSETTPIFSPKLQLSNLTTPHGFGHAPSGHVTLHLVSHEERPRAATLVNSHFSHASQNNASSCQRSQRRRLHS